MKDGESRAQHLLFVPQLSSLGDAFSGCDLYRTFEAFEVRRVLPFQSTESPPFGHFFGSFLFWNGIHVSSE